MLTQLSTVKTRLALTVTDYDGILAALLLPAPSKAKEAARKTKCINNAKQMQLMAQMYAPDNNDLLVRPVDIPGTWSGGTFTPPRATPAWVWGGIGFYSGREINT